MTEVKIINVPGYFRLTAKGHAGYGKANHLPEGHDIVCAAISTLTQTAAQYLMDLDAEGKVKLVELTLEPGKADVKALPRAEGQRQMDVLEQVMRTGFEMVKNAYGNYLKLGWEKNDSGCATIKSDTRERPCK